MTEQLTECSGSENYSYINSLKTDSIHEIWTFSDYNIFILNKFGITKTKFIKMVAWDEYREKLMSYNIDNTYDYDVCIVGWMNDRREQIVQKIREKGISVKIIGYRDELFGDERDKVIRKSKILLNVHYSDNMFCFEQIRCFPFISVGQIIVSEDSFDKVESVIFSDYKNLPDKVYEILKLNFT